MESSSVLPTGLTEISLGDHGLRGWQVDTRLCRARISQQGAQLLEFQARGREPLLWLSPRATFIPGKAIRGGIPLCFPWFGPHPGRPDLPAHGFARQRDWQLTEASATSDALQLEFSLVSDAGTRALWPHDFAATLRMRLGRSVALQLTIANTGSQEFRFEFALHSYFPLTASRAARVEGLDGSLCLDQLDPTREHQHQQGELRFQGETDRIFLHTSGQYCLVDERSERILRIDAPDCRSVIAWNPGPGKTARLADMPPEGWQIMACVESGNVEADAVTLAPGAARAFGLRLEDQAGVPPVGTPLR